MDSCFYNELTIRNTKAIIKDNDDNIELFCEEIRFGFGNRHNKDFIIFHKNYIIITDFFKIGGDDMRRQITSASVDNDISLDEINNESWVLILKNSIDNLKLKWEHIFKLLENDINKKNFSTLSSNYNVSIRLNSIKDVLAFYEACEFVPEHSKLELSGNFYSNIKIYYRKTLCPVPLCLVPSHEIGKSRSSRKFDVNLDYFLFE